MKVGDVGYVLNNYRGIERASMPKKVLVAQVDDEGTPLYIVELEPFRNEVVGVCGTKVYATELEAIEDSEKEIKAECKRAMEFFQEELSKIETMKREVRK